MRDPARAAGLPEGIERAVGNLDDPDSMAKAVHGVEAGEILRTISGMAGPPLRSAP